MQDDSIVHINGFPSVRRFSSLLDYLEMCEVGVYINSDTLDCQPSYKHAKNILTSMGIFEEFEKIFDIKDSNYVAKPDQTSYLIMREKFGLDNENIKRSIFFEDTAKNLKPASELSSHDHITVRAPHRLALCANMWHASAPAALCGCI